MAATDPLQMDRIGEIINRGEFTDLRVVNDPILDSSLIVPNAMSPSATRGDPPKFWRVFSRWVLTLSRCSARCLEGDSRISHQ